MKDKVKNAFFKRYAALPAPAKASLWFLVCNIIQKGLSLLSTPVFTRLLSASEYGMCSNYYSWYGILVLFATFNLSSVAYNNCLTKYEDRKEDITSSLLLLSTFITLICFSIYFILRNYFIKYSNISLDIMLVMFLDFIFYPAFSFWAVKERYDYKYKMLVFVTIASAVISIFSGVLFVSFSESKYEARIISNEFVNIVLGAVLYFKILGKAKFKIIKDFWLEALKISIPLIPLYLSNNILAQADRVMITKMVGSAETGIYSLAYSLSMMVTIVTNAINSTMVPYTYKCLKEKNGERLKFYSSVISMLVLVLCISAMLVAPELIRIFATEEYAAAIWIIPPVALTPFILFLGVLFNNVLFYFEKTLFSMFSSIGAALLNILLNWIFIKRYGYLAAGYTTLSCYLINTAANYVYVRVIEKKYMNSMHICNEKLYIMAGAAGFISIAVSLFLYDFFALRWAVIFLIILVSVIARKQILSLFGEMREK